jgi:hypothetical protein
MFRKSDLDFLLHLGFDIGMARNALMTRSKEQALEYLCGVTLGGKSAVKIWEPPIALRVGSWLPNVADESGSEHTIYFVAVTLKPENYTWQLSKRYAKFHDFHASIKKDIPVAFLRNMLHAFPDDRVNAWVS